MSDEKYLNPETNPFIKTGNPDQEAPAQKNYHSADQIKRAIHTIINSRRLAEVLGDVTVEIINDNDYRINRVKIEDISSEMANRIVDTAGQLEHEKYSNPQENPLIKTDYGDLEQKK